MEIGAGGGAQDPGENLGKRCPRPRQESASPAAPEEKQIIQLPLIFSYLLLAVKLELAFAQSVHHFAGFPGCLIRQPALVADFFLA